MFVFDVKRLLVVQMIVACAYRACGLGATINVADAPLWRQVVDLPSQHRLHAQRTLIIGQPAAVGKFSGFDGSLQSLTGIGIHAPDQCVEIHRRTFSDYWTSRAWSGRLRKNHGRVDAAASASERVYAHK